MFLSGGVGVVFGECAVGDDEELGIFVQPCACPKGVTVVAFDLVEGFSKVDTSFLEFDMDEGQTVDEDGDVVAVGVRGVEC